MITLTENQKLRVTTLATGDMNKLNFVQTIMLTKIMTKVATNIPLTHEEWKIIAAAVLITVNPRNVENPRAVALAMAQYLKPQPTPANN